MKTIKEQNKDLVNQMVDIITMKLINLDNDSQYSLIGNIEYFGLEIYGLWKLDNVITACGDTDDDISELPLEILIEIDELMSEDESLNQQTEYTKLWNEYVEQGEKYRSQFISVIEANLHRIGEQRLEVNTEDDGTYSLDNKGDIWLQIYDREPFRATNIESEDGFQLVMFADAIMEGLANN